MPNVLIDIGQREAGLDYGGSLPDQLFLGISGDFKKFRIHVLETAVGVRDSRCRWALLDGMRELAQPLFDPLALGEGAHKSAVVAHDIESDGADNAS